MCRPHGINGTRNKTTRHKQHDSTTWPVGFRFVPRKLLFGAIPPTKCIFSNHDNDDNKAGKVQSGWVGRR